MADTDTNQETDTTQENFETSADNMGRGLSEQEVEAERIRIQEEWKKYVENSLKNNTSFNGMSDEQKAAELSSFFGVDKDGNVLLKSPHEDGGILKYSTVKNNDGTYNERISFSKEHNKGKEFNQVAADDMARTAITMGWKEIKVSNCETSAKEMIWLAVQKENLLRGTNTQITNFKPSEHSPILKQFADFKAKNSGQTPVEEAPGLDKTPVIDGKKFELDEKPKTIHETNSDRMYKGYSSFMGNDLAEDLASEANPSEDKKSTKKKKIGHKKDTQVTVKSNFLKNEDSEGTIQNPIFGPLKNGSYKETFEENLSPISKFLEKPQTQRDALQQVSKENADKRIEAEANAPKKEGYEYTNFKEFKTAVDNFKTGHKDLKNLSTKDKTELSKIINGGENFAKTTGTSLDIKHAKPRNETKSLIKAVIKVTGPLEQVKKKRNNNTPKNGG